MCHLTDELKKEHAVLLQMLEHVKFSSFEQQELLNYLFEFREKLFDHLDREEKYVYPNLRVRAKFDSKLENLLTNHSNEHLRQIITDFCIRYRFGRSVSSLTDYATTIYDILRARIMSEEIRLFPEYETIEAGGMY
jgi:hypothetical protein